MYVSPCYSTSISWQAPIWRESPYAQETVSGPKKWVSFSPPVVLVSGWAKVITQRIPGGQEWPIKCCCKRKAGSIIDPRQINQLGEWPGMHSRVKEFVISTLCHAGMASIPEGAQLLRTNLKNRSDSPSAQAKITPSNTPFYYSTWGICFCSKVKGNLLQCCDFLYPSPHTST